MATNSQDLLVGSWVSFTKNREFFQGTVYFFNGEDSSFGIDDVSRTKPDGKFGPVDGYFNFTLEEIKNLKVICSPVPKSTTTKTKGGQKPNPGPGGASSSSSK